MIVYVWLVHWFADFVCQSRWMADNKSHNWYALGLHVAIYTAVMILLLAPFGDHWFTPPSHAIWFVAVTFITHFATDAVTSRVNAYAYETHPKLFWCSVGFDQWIHFATLWYTLKLLESMQ